MSGMRQKKLAEKSSYKRRIRNTKAPHFRQMWRRAFSYALILMMTLELKQMAK